MDLVILGLAVHQAVNIYRYSAYFRAFRAAREIEQPVWFLPPGDRFQRWFRELVACPWCLSCNVAGILAILYYCLPLGRLLCIALAASQLAGLLHFLTGHRGVKQDSAR